MRAVVAGASGLIGTQLSRALRDRGDEVVALPRFGSAPWSVEGADAVVNLAGASVAGKRWTAAYKKEIEQSRVSSTRALVDAIAAARRKPRVLVNASAVGYYGGRGDEVLDERAAPGADFLANVSRQWEAEAQRAPVRSVQLRTGVVLSANGGALAKMLPPFKAFVGGPIGSGKQWFPWIHIADEVGAIRFLLEREDARGPFNLTAPRPLTNRDFSRSLGRALRRPSLFPAPGFALRLALGEMADMLLYGQRAVPHRLLEHGYIFRWPEALGALREILA